MSFDDDEERPASLFYVLASCLGSIPDRLDVLLSTLLVFGRGFISDSVLVILAGQFL